MIDIQQLQRVLPLQTKAFALLRWVSKQLRARTLDLSVVHQKMGLGEAAEEWIRRNLDRLPSEIRPAADELRLFARLFASFLQTSFEPAANERKASHCGCYCSYCSYMTNAPYLKPRKLSKKAHQAASDLKRIYLDELAKASNARAGRDKLDSLASESSPIAREIALGTYARELLRRSEFASQGEGVYGLWREIAWMDGHPDPKFKLTAETVEQAQNTIAAFLGT